MAFPTITSITKSNDGGSPGTNHTVSMPTLASGDLAIVVFASDGQETVTWPTGWTSQPGGWSDSSNPAATISIAYRICDGSATDNSGGTITVQTGTSEEAVALVIRIESGNWHGTTPPEGSASSMANTTTPDPPSETASWGGSEDNLFIAGHGGDGGDGITVSSYPSGYTANNDAEQGGNGSGFASVSSKESAADTDDPGTLTISSGRHSAGYTLVVRPAAAGGLTVDTSESVTASDVDRFGFNLGARPSDAATVTDVDTVAVTPLEVSQSEAVTASDVDTVTATTVRITVSEAETATVTDVDTVTLVGADLSRSVSEAVTVADQDTVQVQTVRLTVNVSDAITTTDVDRFGFNLGARPSESVTVTDVDTVTANAAADLEASEFEAVTVTDVDTVQATTVRITVSDAESVTVSDADTVVVEPLAVSQFEAVTVADVDTVAVAGGAPITVSVSDAVTTTDQTTAAVSPLTVTAFESVTVADVGTVTATTVRIAVDVSESVSVVDDDTAAVDPLLVEAQEAIAAWTEILYPADDE